MRLALMIVDMQRYYLEEESDYCQYFNSLYSGSLVYIRERCEKTVIPNIQRLKLQFSKKGFPVIYLRLCSKDNNREDLHRFFRKSWMEGVEHGYDSVYPMENDPMSNIIDELEPSTKDIVINKTTFSPFSFTLIEEKLSSLGINTIVFTGLATSQCVETTARDASDRGYTVVHIHDAQADYDQNTHEASLFSSRGVCGGIIHSTEDLVGLIKDMRG
ncbi:MAG: isochorismatase family cysteine hydrolase [Spirochaetota bacterium]